MADRDLESGTKEPGSVSGAPYPPARRHSDGPEERPRRHVPTGTPEPDQETDDPPVPTDVESEEDQDHGDS